MTDVIPEGATEITLCMIDELTYGVIKGDGSQSLAKWEALQYFLGTLSPEDQASRKTHCMVVNILAAVESFDPYDLTFEDSKLSADEDALDHATPLVWWSKQQWEILEERIFQLMEKCGATESALFQCVLNTILLNETLASIRCEVEEELTKKLSGPVVIDAHLVSKFVKDVRRLDNDDVRRELEILLVQGTGSRPTRSNSKSIKGVTLKPIQDLRTIMGSNPFRFGYIQRKIHKLIGKWAYESLPSLEKYVDSREREKPKKRKIRAIKDDSDKEDKEAPSQAEEEEDGDESSQEKNDESEVEETVEKTKSSSRAVHERPEVGGVQILDDEYEKDDGSSSEASVAVDSPARKRRKRVDFTSEEKEAIKDGAKQIGAHLPGNTQWSQIRALFPEILKKRNSKAIRNCYKTMVRNGYIAVDEDDDEESDDDEEEEESRPQKKARAVSIPTGGVRRGRKRWSVEEYDAVRAGVRKHKVGAWALIKKDDEFREALRNRTNVQIKDAYRVLCNRGDS